MLDYLIHLYHSGRTIVNDWSHALTAGLGLGFAIAPSVDLATRLLGALAIIVSIWCSFRRDRREERAARLEEILKLERKSGPYPALYRPEEN